MGGRGIGARRPVDAVEASVPKCTSRASRTYIPAAHEVTRLCLLFLSDFYKMRSRAVEAPRHQL